jgi:hypothetical protein
VPGAAGIGKHGDVMKEKIKALALVAALILLTYPIERHAVETRVFLLHVVVVLLLDVVVSMVRFSRPSDKG